MLRRYTRTLILCDERADTFIVNRLLQVHDTHVAALRPPLWTVQRHRHVSHCELSSRGRAFGRDVVNSDSVLRTPTSVCVAYRRNGLAFNLLSRLS